jgi:hypothetical protein
MQRPVTQNSVIYENNLFTTFYLGDAVKEKDVDGSVIIHVEEDKLVHKFR